MSAAIVPKPGMEQINWEGVPFTFRYPRQRISAVVRNLEEAEDLVAFFGDAAFCPFLPVLVMVPGHTPILVVGDGEASAAELRDLCVATYERAIQRMLANNGRPFDFAALREKHGLLPREHRDAAFRNALLDRIERHKRNPITDPAVSKPATRFQVLIGGNA